MIRTLTATAVVMLTVASGVAAAAPSYPATIPLPPAFQPEGIAIRANTFYVGSIPTGAVYRGEPADRNRRACSSKDRPDALRSASQWTTATGCSSQVGRQRQVRSSTTRALEQTSSTYALAPGFINDVVVTRTGAYFTNSNRRGALPDPDRQRGPARLDRRRRIPLTGSFRAGHRVQRRTGSTRRANGRWLDHRSEQHRASSSASTRRRVRRPRSHSAAESVPNGDGILLDGKTLYVVQNQLNRIAVISVNAVAHVGPGRDADHGRRASPIPTTIDDLGRRLYAVNARFGSPPATTDYQVVQVRKPNGQLSTRRAGAASASARQIIRRSAAQRVSSWRLESCSLRSTLETWLSTVLTERCRLAAISL